MLENYAALAAAIIKSWPPERAIAEVYREPIPSSSAFANEMLFFKNQGWSWEEIGEIFGVRSATAYRAVRRLQKRQEVIRCLVNDVGTGIGPANTGEGQ